MKHARPDYDRIQDPENKIPADEPVFLLRAQDKFAADTLAFWIRTSTFNNALIKEDIVSSARAQYHRMKLWELEHGSKVPDMPATGSITVKND